MMIMPDCPPNIQLFRGQSICERSGAANFTAHIVQLHLRDSRSPLSRFRSIIGMESGVPSGVHGIFVPQKLNQSFFCIKMGFSRGEPSYGLSTLCLVEAANMQTVEENI